MMVVKVFGIMDLLASISFILISFGWFKGFAVFMAVYLVLKGIIFFSDIASWLDMASGVYLFLIFLGVSPALSIVCILWLLQKAIISILS